MSDPDRNITLPVSPVEVSNNIDLAHPIEWDRQPKNPPKAPKGRGRKRVKLSDNKLEQGLLAPKVRKLRWPELFHGSRYAVDLIKEMRESFPIPAEIDVWVKDVIASGVPEDQREKFIVALHPGVRRPALFELVNNPIHGPAYKCISIFHTGEKKGCLPTDLQSTDKRWNHLRGWVGDFRWPTKNDFCLIREYADRRTVGSVAIAMKQEELERREYAEKNRVQDDIVADIHDYGFMWLNTVANNGKKSYSVATVDVKSNPDVWYIEKRPGYTVKVNKLHAPSFVEKLRAEQAGLEITARERPFKGDIEDDWLKDALAARAERVAKDVAESAEMTPELREKKREEKAAARLAEPVRDETIDAFLARRRARIESGDLQEVVGERIRVLR